MIQTKKKELLEFIGHQTIGPGALNGRLRYINEDGINDYELLNAPPAKYYCSGILFPEKEAEEQILPEEPERDESEEEVDGEDPKNPSAMTADDIVTGNQTFPANMGITVALSEDCQWADVKMTASYRIYHKLSSKEAIRDVCVRLDMPLDQFNEMIELYQLTDLLGILTKDRTHYVRYVDGNHSQELIAVTRPDNHIFRNRMVDQGKFNGPDVGGLSINQIRARMMRAFKQDMQNEQLLSSLNMIDSYTMFRGHLQTLIDLSRKDVWVGHEIVSAVPISKRDLSLAKDEFSLFLNKNEPLIIHQNDNSKLEVNYLLTSDRRHVNNKTKYLKIQLINTSKPIEKNPERFYSVDNRDVNTRSFFGIGIQVQSDKLLPYNHTVRNNVDDEDMLNKYLYREFLSYGTGHGCSIKWDAPNKLVSSTYLPFYSSPEVEASPRIKSSIIQDEDSKEFIAEPFFTDDSFLQIQRLSTFHKDDIIIESLSTLVEGYDSWIQQKKDLIPTSTHPELHQRIVESCEKDSKRLHKNLKLLNENPKYRLIFCYMNSAMLMQMLHGKNDGLNLPDRSKYTIDFYSTKTFVINGQPPKWRPFQLAFILLNIDSIFTPNVETRETVDLIWFPTGGGKTEAYLSLIALTIMSRRVFHGDEGAGTAVIMRYTLRLLALQQFQRATLLIMSLELLRRWNLPDLPLGTIPITIGLWTGIGLTSNTFQQLREQIEKIMQQVQMIQPDQDTPRIKDLTHQKCPWCNNPLVWRNRGLSNLNYYFDVTEKRSFLYCANDKCIFSKEAGKENPEPLPIITCDEEIYWRPPALLFGTVDKFAALAHRVSDDLHNDSRRLFGNPHSTWGDRKIPIPPDMIIQDELHLISGPLGSSTALVETAIQELCVRDTKTGTYGAKIISSTATIRNSKDQVGELYGKNVNLFPKPGPEADDSFFAFYKRSYTDNDPKNFKFISKRGYLGFLPTGRSQMWTQLRLTAICLVHRIVYDKEHRTYPSTASFAKALDSYHTVLSYFNSLKELGKTDSQVNTYLEQEVRRVYKNLFYVDWLAEVCYTERINKSELTGRLSGEEVKTHLLNIEKSIDVDSLISRGQAPPDFVMATNMISVGLDISRLNTMIVNGMPRSISEYIQATSRVARESAGVVLTVHHPYRNRDVSHFEKFLEFHQTFYGHVEPISITPRARKTLDKFLSLYIAILARHKFPKLATNKSVVSITDKDTNSNLRSYLKKVVNDKPFPNANKIVFEKWIDESLDQWMAWVTENQHISLVFEHLSSNKTSEQQQKLYQNPYIDRSNPLQEKWRVPHSLRSVEEGTVINIKPL